ncbi:hypothetical protein T265_05107 [Opisthorchis viverrini]|uniref:Uncharacterized protein n=1 Tax=Opisthorchis viverrini TaxID=6198 RepID=A0A074ZQ86_OPIVI|nr:hypothetical protein T265_05107 [Opisthorchis viverrini]KER27987.1 hypothetical protein T265_05107 [Opisthorchis viverrini]
MARCVRSINSYWKALKQRYAQPPREAYVAFPLIAAQASIQSSKVPLVLKVYHLPQSSPAMQHLQERAGGYLFTGALPCNRRRADKRFGARAARNLIISGMNFARHIEESEILLAKGLSHLNTRNKKPRKQNPHKTEGHRG